MKKIELEKEFIGTAEVSGFKFTQIYITEHVNCYQIDLGNGNIHFELFKRLFSPVCIDFKKRIYSLTDFKEVYPKANEFGIRAWTYHENVPILKIAKELNENILKSIAEKNEKRALIQK